MIEPVPKSPPLPLDKPFTMGNCLQFVVEEIARGNECRARQQSLADWATAP